ncbi:MAG: polysaccharide pyruvyl transferase family protein [Bacteroidota bacterium]
MSVKNFLIQQFTHFNRLSRKNKVINGILNNEHFENNGVINVHRTDLRNAGDFYCGPHHYFEQIKGRELDIFEYKDSDQKILDNYHNLIVNNSLIIGGGGLLNRPSFEKPMKMFEQLAEKGKKTVLWGVGHNEKNRNTFGKVTSYNVDTSKFGLVGVRDYDMGKEWVPCVSCLHPIMDTKLTVENEVGLIYHKKTLKNKRILNSLNDYPSTSNTTNIEEIITFIAKSDTIVTDSYHAMYWAMLLNKKVVALPNSSKFYSFKYKPTFSDFENFKNDLKKAEKHSGILEECREINLKFGKKVFDYLGK